jgi:hypothetical protein
MTRPLLAISLALTLVAPVPAAFGADIETIRISTVLASNSGRNWDERLEPIRKQLRRLRFKSYHLMGTQTRSVRSGDECGIELPNDRFLHVTTEEITSRYLRLHILLNENNRPIINTDVKLNPSSVVLLGGPQDSAGTLIISIAAIDSEPAAAAKSAPAPTARVADNPVPVGAE